MVRLGDKEIEKMIRYLRLCMIDPVDRNICGRDNFMFYFNKFLELKAIKIKNDVLAKREVVNAQSTKWATYIFGIVSQH